VPRVTLFRLFLKIWNSIAVNCTSDPVGSDLAAERNLNQMTAKPRQAFLLVSDSNARLSLALANFQRAHRLRG
jgi:hypothetical protein